MESQSPMDQSPQENKPRPPEIKPGDPGEAAKAEPRQSANPTGRKRGPRATSANDITPVLKGWDYEAGTVNVRKVVGLDGTPKLQMRLDLGLLQMELTGRPDGLRPHGCESLLEFHEQRLLEHTRARGASTGFRLSDDDCQMLRDEAAMYYRRYLSLFVLGEFSGVVRDTERNLRVLDMCGKFAASKSDRLVLEQYRPYIVMMNTRAAASLYSRRKEYAEALRIVRMGLKKIRRFFHRFGQDEAYPHASEVHILRRFGAEIQRKLPVDPVRRLERRLQRAVKAENYEEAAKLRDMIQAQAAHSSGPATE